MFATLADTGAFSFSNPIHYSVIVTGVLCAMSCALLGNFLVLRRMSMMGDAISHAVLPGLALAFLFTGSRDSAPMFIGAAAIGLLTAVFTQWVHSVGKVDENASMGVVFTSLFAFGLLLMRQAADYVDLDPECVLYGGIEQVYWDDAYSVLGVVLPRAALRSGVILLINAGFIVMLYKEFKISTFDPTLATTLGINSRLMHYLLMTLVAVTTVASFESVGSILVIAMLIVPPATAYLLTERFGVMILLSLAIAAASAVLGHVGAMTVPRWFGFPDTTSAGMMAVATGVLFSAALVFSPRQGVLSKVTHRFQVGLRVTREDVLGLLYRLGESGIGGGRPGLIRDLLRRTSGAPAWSGALALWSLRRRGEATLANGEYQLTDRGRAAAGQLVRSHRLWEAYLERYTAAPVEHVHYSAEQLEHVTDAAMQARLAQIARDAVTDPHGKQIPPAASDTSQ